MSENPQTMQQLIMSARRKMENGRVGAVGDGTSAPRRGRLLPLLYGLAAVALVGGVGVGLFHFDALGDVIAQAAPKQAVAPVVKSREPHHDEAASDPAAASDPFRTLAKQAGVNACAATYAGLGKALTDGTQFMVQTQSAKTDADRHSLVGVVGMAFRSSKDGAYAGPAAGIVFAAPAVHGCEGGMVRVVPFAQSCQAAASLLPEGSQPQEPLAGLQVFALATGGQAMLMPAGEGCVAISIIRAGGA